MKFDARVVVDRNGIRFWQVEDKQSGDMLYVSAEGSSEWFVHDTVPSSSHEPFTIVESFKKGWND